MKTTALAAVALLIAGSSFVGFAQDPAPAKDSYSFSRVVPTPVLKPYSTTLYSGNRNTVTSMLGHPIHFVNKDTIFNFEVNPMGINFFAIEKEKGKNKRRTGTLYSTAVADEALKKFDVKKYGEPLAVCFTPDARNIIVATTTGLQIFEPKELKPVATLPELSFVPDGLTVSPNGYYLVAYGDGRAVVFNLEERSVRKQLNIGENITELLFSPDSSDMVILTDDGVASIYNTRSFDMRKMVDDLGEALAASYNFDGKYLAVVINPNTIVVVNLLRDSDREYFPITEGGVLDVTFIADSRKNTLLAYPTLTSVEARRMANLKPFYNQLIADETEQRLQEWMKMMPGETLEQYRERVSDEARARQRSLIEYEITTRLAGDLVSGMEVSLGSYDRANSVLALEFDSMPSIFIPVPEADVAAFGNPSDLELRDVLYGVNPDDSFEIVYADVLNRKNGKSYIYDNLARAEMDYLKGDNAISLEVLQQQQMEELRLMELREKVMQEAKNMDIISDHTNIAVSSRLVPDYDANGEKILNYQVTFTYDVAPGFSAEEDFGPGKYHVEESGAAQSMLRIVKEAFEGDMAQYMKQAKKLKVTLTGTADATPIVRGIPYDGSYGDFEDEPVFIDGQLAALSVNSSEPIKENPQLAFLRASGVRDFLDRNVDGYGDINKDYRYVVNVSEDKGSEFRRITADFTFVDAF